MNEELAARHAGPIARCLGASGRLIGLSKTGYRRQYPDHVMVFNANVCFGGGKVWWGDLDLTVDESQLIQLAAETGETVCVLYEWDGRFQNEDAPLLERAVYSVAPSGHSSFAYAHVERRADGALYERPLTRPPRFRRPGRPRLWRFWLVERRPGRSRDPRDDRRSTLIYAGRRGAGSPLLVLGVHAWARQERGVMLEYTWYPSGPRRWAPPVALRLKWRRGRVRPFVVIRIIPGVCAELRAGVSLGRLETPWG